MDLRVLQSFTIFFLMCFSFQNVQCSTLCSTCKILAHCLYPSETLFSTQLFILFLATIPLVPSSNCLIISKLWGPSTNSCDITSHYILPHREIPFMPVTFSSKQDYLSSTTLFLYTPGAFNFLNGIIWNIFPNVSGNLSTAHPLVPHYQHKFVCRTNIFFLSQNPVDFAWLY